MTSSGNSKRWRGLLAGKCRTGFRVLRSLSAIPVWATQSYHSSATTAIWFCVNAAPSPVPPARILFAIPASTCCKFISGLTCSRMSPHRLLSVIVALRISPTVSDAPHINGDRGKGFWDVVIFIYSPLLVIQNSSLFLSWITTSYLILPCLANILCNWIIICPTDFPFHSLLSSRYF